MFRTLFILIWERRAFTQTFNSQNVLAFLLTKNSTFEDCSSAESKWLLFAIVNLLFSRRQTLQYLDISISGNKYLTPSLVTYHLHLNGFKQEKDARCFVPFFYVKGFILSIIHSIFQCKLRRF